MYQALIIIHVLIAVAIIAFVLLQQGRGADAGAAFGSGASGTVFGARGAASFLTRTTAVLAALFFSSSLILAYLTSGSGPGSLREAKDIMDEPETIEIAPDLPGLDKQPVDLSDIPVVPKPLDSTEVLTVPAQDNNTAQEDFPDSN